MTEYSFSHPIPPRRKGQSLYSRYADELIAMPVSTDDAPVSIFVPVHHVVAWSRIVKLVFSRQPFIGHTMGGYFTVRTAIESSCKGCRVWKLKSLPTPSDAGPTAETSTSP